MRRDVAMISEMAVEATEGHELTRWWNAIPARMRFTFIASMLTGFLVHMFVFTNKLMVQDEVLCLFADEGIYTRSVYFQSGRWLLPTAFDLTSNVSMPWVLGSLSILFLSLTICLIVSLLNIRSQIHILLMTVLLMTASGVGELLGYMFTASAYLGSLLMTVYGVYLAKNRGWGGAVAAVVLFAVGMGLYQAYIFFAITLCAVMLLRDLLRSDADMRETVSWVIRCNGGGALGVVLYLLILKICLAATGLELGAYQGIDQMGKMSLSAIPGRLFLCVESLTKYFLVQYGYAGWVPWTYRIVGAVVFLMVGFSGIRLCMMARKLPYGGWRATAAFLILAGMPVACNLIAFSGAATIGLRMMLSVTLLYVLLPVFSEVAGDDTPGAS